MTGASNNGFDVEFPDTFLYQRMVPLRPASMTSKSFTPTPLRSAKRACTPAGMGLPVESVKGRAASSLAVSERFARRYHSTEGALGQSTRYALQVYSVSLQKRSKTPSPSRSATTGLGAAMDLPAESRISTPTSNLGCRLVPVFLYQYRPRGGGSLSLPTKEPSLATLGSGGDGGPSRMRPPVPQVSFPPQVCTPGVSPLHRQMSKSSKPSPSQSATVMVSTWRGKIPLFQ